MRTALSGLLLILLLFAPSAYAWDSYIMHSRDAYIHSVEDGNVLLVGRRRGENASPDWTVYLYGIGIPAQHQPFAREAHDLLLRLLPKGQKITMDSISMDEEGRMTALVQVRGNSVNHMLLAEGLAWVDRRTCRAFFCRQWLIQEHVARKERRGLWGLNMSTPPWQWGMP